MPQVLIESKREPGKTKLVSERDAKTLVKLGRWRYATTALEGGPPAPTPRKGRKRTPTPAPTDPETPPEPEPTPPTEPTE